MKKYKLKGKTYICSKEDIHINDWITDGYNVWQWEDNSSLLGREKVILTDDINLESVVKLTKEQVGVIWKR